MVLSLGLVSPSSVLARLSDAWAYVGFGASAILTEELAPLLAGFAAEQGHLRYVSAVVACALGIWIANVLLYLLGRWRAAWVRLKIRKSAPVVRRLLRAMRWSPWRSTILGRFVFGARIVLPLACGAAHIRPWVFLTGTAIACALWSAIFVSLGWFFGESAVMVLGRVRRYENELAILLVLLGLTTWLIVMRRRARARKRAEAKGVRVDTQPIGLPGLEE
jgi:membrane protein DedA with SNARE-associated domain